MSSKKTLLFGTLAASAIVASSLVYASRDVNEEHNDAAALAQAKISLSQAIAAAEQKVSGKAVRAELEDENGTFVYGVEVVNGGKSTDVKVDIGTGAILSAQADQADHEGDENGNEGDESGRESGHDK